MDLTGKYTVNTGCVGCFGDSVSIFFQKWKQAFMYMAEVQENNAAGLKFLT